MEQIIVTHLDGSTLKLQSKQNVSKITQAKQTVELNGADTVDITIESASKLAFSIGDKITIIGRDYTLNTPAKERKISEAHFVYDLQFEGVQYDLLRCNYNVNVDTTNNQIQDINGNALTGDLKRFLDVLISNANRVFPGKWSLGSYPANTETRTEVFGEGDNCLSVLQSLCGEDKYNAEFKIAIDANGNRTLSVGTFGTVHNYTFEYGKSKGIFELVREKLSSSNIITRLYVYGSSKNINTSKYRADRLCLPGKSKAQSYIQDANAVAKYGIWESTKIFEDVFPHRTGTITGLGGSELKFIDSTMDFDLNAKDGSGNSLYLLAGQSASIKFNTGNLAGYEFEVSYDHATKQFTLIAQTDENGYTFPSPTSSAFQFSVGDKYVITNIYMPQGYIDTEEANLSTKASPFYAKYCQPRVQYGLTVDSFYLKNIVGADAESNIIWVGDYIPIKDTDLDVDKSIRVKGFTRNLLKDYSYNLTISDLPVQVSTISRVVSGINGFDKIIKINDLNDPAKARRNYLNAQEVLSMVFDVEGDYYTDKIKPESIETIMLSVGAKSMQFGLVGTILQPNYAGQKNRVVYSGGVLTHYAILDESGNPRVWNITDGDIVLATDAAYYIYVKCERAGSGASLLFSSSKIAVESDGSYYHFLMGVINSVGANNERAVALMYGFTTINGRFIKTGRIQSADGNTYFDLDAGEFQGNFKFITGDSIKDAVDTATSKANAATLVANAAQTTANSAQSTANSASSTASNAQSVANQAYNNANIAQASADDANNSIYVIVSDNYLSGDEKPAERSRWNDVAAEKSGIDSQADTFSISRTTYDNAFQALANYLNGGSTWSSGIPSWLSDANLGSATAVSGATYRSKWNDYFVARQSLLNAIAAKAKQIADAAQTTANSAQSTANSASSTANAASAAAAALDYLKTALQGSTDISGGLLATNVLLMKDSGGAIKAGMSGLTSDNVGIWAGGTYAQAIAGTAKIILRKDGSGQVAGGNISWNTSGTLTVTGTINSSAGSIGGFTISASQLQATSGYDQMLLSAGLLRFNDSADNNWVYIGGDVMPSSLGGSVSSPMRIEVGRVASGYYGNIGIYLSVTGTTPYDDSGYQYTGNHALYIPEGDICGFRLRTRRITFSQTLSEMDSVIIAGPSSAITLYLPASPKIGQMYIIRRATNVNITINANGNYISWKAASDKGSSTILTSWAVTFIFWDHVNSIWWAGITSSM